MAFLSEIHYRNSVAGSSGVAEYVEISVAPEDMGRLSDFEVVTYQTDGTVRESFILADVSSVLDPNTGWYVFQITTRVTDPDHLSGSNEAEAVAFIDQSLAAPVQTFVDIGGGTTGIVAVEGPVAGATSTTIEASDGQSIQFDVYGNRLDGDITQGSSVICLTAGTLIETGQGPVPIEALEVGDMIVTHDSGLQPIRMIHQRRLSSDQLQRNRKLWPVCIEKGALGFGLPLRRLLVSPQHRMLYQHIRLPLMFGEDAVFVRAKSLAMGFENIYVDSSVTEVTYFHLVFDKHEVIFAEGAPTESFHPGPEGIAALDADARDELFTLFPHLRFGNESHAAEYRTLRSWEVMAVTS